MKIMTKFNIGETIYFKWFGKDFAEKIRGVCLLEDKIYYQTKTLKLIEEGNVICKVNI